MTNSFHLLLTVYFPDIQTWINILKVKVGFHRKKKTKPACSACLETAMVLWHAWALCAHSSFIRQNIKKIYTQISRLNAVYYFASSEMVFSEPGICWLWVCGGEKWNDSYCSWVLLLQQVYPLLLWPISINISIKCAGIFMKIILTSWTCWNSQNNSYLAS